METIEFEPRRPTMAEQITKQQQEQLMDQAVQEDQLLLATIRSTLENPKYGF